jgi:hypothetical protein
MIMGLARPGGRAGLVRLRHEVARRQAQPAQQRENLPEFAGVVAAHPEPGGHQVFGCPFRRLPAARGDLG